MSSTMRTTPTSIINATAGQIAIDIAAAVATTSNATSIMNSGDANVMADCQALHEEIHHSYLGVELAVSDVEAFFTVIVLSLIIILTVVGNVLVILSVFTYKPLRIVQNFFIVSLAVADLTVALLVLPFNVAYSILGRWGFGIPLCKMWLTCDVMCCTSSILNLCVIALDRYWAITDPIDYAQKRTVGRVLFLIAGVWVLSFLISSPPLMGWNNWSEDFAGATSTCELNSDPGYIIYSSLGSFFIPLAIMTIVYIEIYIATRRRLRERAHASKIMLKQKATARGSGIGIVAPAAHDRDAAGASRFDYLCTDVWLCCWLRTAGQQRSSNCPGLAKDQESISSELQGQHDKAEAVHDVGAGGDGSAGQQVVIVKEKQTQKTSKGNTSLLTKRASAVKETNNCELSTYTKDDAAKEAFDESQNDFNNCRSADSKEQQHKVTQMYDNKEGLAMSTMTTEAIQQSPINQSSGDEKKHVPSPPPLTVYQFIEEKQKISLSKERRAARTLGIIMGVFVICWLPFFLMYTILPFCRMCCPTTRLKNFITWLGYINSGLNPVIYTIFNLDYRRAFKRLLGIN